MDFYPGIFLPLKPFDLAGDLSHMVIALLKAMKEPWMPESGIPLAEVPGSTLHHREWLAY